jgi:hypothetical protein
MNETVVTTLVMAVAYLVIVRILDFNHAGRSPRGESEVAGTRFARVAFELVDSPPRVSAAASCAFGGGAWRTPTAGTPR